MLARLFISQVRPIRQHGHRVFAAIRESRRRGGARDGVHLHVHTRISHDAVLPRARDYVDIAPPLNTQPASWLVCAPRTWYYVVLRSTTLTNY